MRIRTLFYALCTALMSFSCGNPQKSSESEILPKYEIKGAKLKLTEVEGGTFAMGTLTDKRLVEGADHARQVLVDGFAISQPISQKLWKAVMGNNPSTKADENLPVDMVSYKDAEKFVSKISKITGVSFFLPSEAIWEWAVRKSAIVPVKGTREWCSADSEMKVVHTAKSREEKPAYTKAGALIFRIAAISGKPCPQEMVDMVRGIPMERETSCANETITVAGTDFKMVAVEEGSFTMGGTAEQEPYSEEDEFPETSTSVAGFELLSTEVTVAQWLAVMDELPLGNYADEPDKPVVNVSWYAAQEYILKLREITGRKFRLPSEAEWEYAARGGSKGQRYRYAGDNSVKAVAVHVDNTPSRKVQNVKSLKPNELGLYDMSGNAWEWCQDSYALYGKETPDVNVKVMRGGSASSRWNACRVSNRSAMPADNTKGSFGFRLAI